MHALFLPSNMSGKTKGFNAFLISIMIVVFGWIISEIFRTKSMDIKPVLLTSNKESKQILFYGIYTRAKNKLERSRIRKGINEQLLLIPNISNNSFNKIQFTFKFIIATLSPNIELINETNKYNDIIILNIKDNINKGKTYEYFKYISNNHNISDNSMIFKADIDTIICLSKLYQSMLDLNFSRYIYYGRINDNYFCGGGRNCPGKECTHFRYPKRKCWIYMSGGMYGMTKSLVKKMMYYYHTKKKMHEDMMVGKWIKRSRLNYKNLIIRNYSNGNIWCHDDMATKKWSNAVNLCSNNFKHLHCSK